MLSSVAAATIVRWPSMVLTGYIHFRFGFGWKQNPTFLKIQAISVRTRIKIGRFSRQKMPCMADFVPSGNHILYTKYFDLSFSIYIVSTPSYSTLSTDSVWNLRENLVSSKVGLWEMCRDRNAGKPLLRYRREHSPYYQPKFHGTIERVGIASFTFDRSCLMTKFTKQSITSLTYGIIGRSKWSWNFSSVSTT